MAIHEFNIGAKLARAVLACASKDAARPILQAFKLEYKKGEDNAKLVATDTHRLIIVDVRVSDIGSAKPGTYTLKSFTKTGMVVERWDDAPPYPNWTRVIPSDDKLTACGTYDADMGWLRLNEAFFNVNYLPTAPGLYEIYTQGEGRPYVFKNCVSKYVIMPISRQ